MTDKDDEAVRGWTGCVVVAVAVGMAVASVLIDSLLLPLAAVPVAAGGSLIGLFARGTMPGRVATAGGLVAALLGVGAALFVYGRAMAGTGVDR